MKNNSQLKIINDYIDSLNVVCFSGGAQGADRLFGLYSLENNIPYIHFSFDKHSSNEPNLLSVPAELLESQYVNSKLKTACRTLKRKVPYVGSYVYNLLARNYFQIYKTERIYAMGKLNSPTEVDGGTAWAVQMYLDECVEQNKNAEIYFFCIKTHKVYSYNNSIKIFEEVDGVPIPFGKWTGIGSRSATNNDLISFRKKFHE